MVKKTEQSTRTSVSSLWSEMVQRKLSLSECLETIVHNSQS